MQVEVEVVQAKQDPTQYQEAVQLVPVAAMAAMAL